MFGSMAEWVSHVLFFFLNKLLWGVTKNEVKFCFICGDEN